MVLIPNLDVGETTLENIGNVTAEVWYSFIQLK